MGMALAEPRSRWQAVAWVVAATACGPSVPIDDASSDGSTTSEAPAASGDTSSGDTSSGDTSSGDTVSDPCLSACGARAWNEANRGWCTVAWAEPLVAGCAPFCEQVAPLLSPAELDAALLCLEEDAACFTTMEMCVCWELETLECCWDLEGCPGQ